MRREAPASITHSTTPAPLLPRYERPHEDLPRAANGPCRPVAASRIDTIIATSSLSTGAKALLRGLLRLGTTRIFPGGGVGIEYGSLLKTAARPEYIAGHVAEAAAHLRQREVDLLLVPGMSGYPVGAMYSVVASIPAILLKKAVLVGDGQETYPAGAFIIPSYTGEGDMVIHADPAAVQDMVESVVAPQLAAQQDVARPHLTLRAAGADDIIDKATMCRAVGESAVIIGQSSIETFIARHRAATGDTRQIETRVEVVAWVTPLIKEYNQPQEHLQRSFGILPFAGINVTSVHHDPPAVGIEGVGTLPFFRPD